MISGVIMKGKGIIIPFFITETDIMPTVQQTHRDRKDVSPYARISILDQHKCQHRVCGQALCHMLGMPVNTAPIKGTTL